MKVSPRVLDSGNRPISDKGLENVHVETVEMILIEELIAIACAGLYVGVDRFRIGQVCCRYSRD